MENDIEKLMRYKFVWVVEQRGFYGNYFCRRGQCFSVADGEFESYFL